jgi:LAS superfamily LD-carboxypeptidase LdcB
MERFRAAGLTPEQVAAGSVDQQVTDLLKITAIPGFSRHHTGYTVDISCESNKGVIFENTTCFRWLSQNNYQHAKESGWIPSYPPGAGDQGPNPEAWEYVWVGTPALYE